MAKKTIGVTNRRNGHNFERLLAKFLRDQGDPFKMCKTSREASRLYDNCKIDLWGIPFLVQAKHGQQKGMAPQIILKQMTQLIKENFPEDSKEHDMLKCVVHKKPAGKGFKSDKYDTLVYMAFEDFITIFKDAYGNNRN